MKLYGEKVNKSSSSAKSLHANEAIIEEEDENNTDKECTNYKSDNSSLCKCELIALCNYYCNNVLLYITVFIGQF